MNPLDVPGSPTLCGRNECEATQCHATKTVSGVAQVSLQPVTAERNNQNSMSSPA